MADLFKDLEQGVLAALETYSNVHRGSGHNSIVSTVLFEQAREMVLEYLGLAKGKYVVIFCTPRRAAALVEQLNPRNYQCISSREIGLPLGVNALAVKRKALPEGAPFQAGGGTTRLVSPGWVIWAKAPDKFEAGTPAIINIIAFAKALCLMRQSGMETFPDPAEERLAAIDILYNDGLEKFTGKELLDQLKQTLIGRRILVPTVEGNKPYINLDNGASTPTFSPVFNAFCQTWRQPLQVQEEIVQEVRSVCAEVLGAPRDSYDVIFTSNTTEAINLVAESLSHESEQDNESVLVNTILEHNSNDLPWRMIPGSSLIRLPVDDEGFINLKELEALLSAYNQEGKHGKKRIRLVAVTGASNVLGVYNNLGEISRIVHHYGARLLVDAAQMAAHRKVEMESWGIDYLAFSAHKVYAPFGCGVLIIKKGLIHFTSAGLEVIRSSGEENTAGIAALGKALVLLQRIGMDLVRMEEQALTKRALQGMKRIRGLRIYGITETDSPVFDQKGGIIVFSLKGMMSDRVAKALAEQGGIGVRYGCHCAHILIKHLVGVTPLLEQFQGIIVTLFPKLRLPGLVRMSLGIENNEEDVDTFIHVLGQIAQPTRRQGHGKFASPQDRTPVLSPVELQHRIKDFVRKAALRVYSPCTEDKTI